MIHISIKNNNIIFSSLATAYLALCIYKIYIEYFQIETKLFYTIFYMKSHKYFYISPCWKNKGYNFITIICLNDLVNTCTFS